MEYITQTAGPKVELRHRFNEELVQQVREGKLAIENTDEAKTIALIAYIFPSDVSTLGLTNFYWASTPNCWTSDEATSIPSRPVSDFFLPAQPLRIEDVTDKQVIHCETEEQAKSLSLLGAILSDRSPLSLVWRVYENQTCFNPAGRAYASKSFYQDEGFEILPASLFLQPPTEKEGKETNLEVKPEVKRLFVVSLSFRKQDSHSVTTQNRTVASWKISEGDAFLAAYQSQSKELQGFDLSSYHTMDITELAANNPNH